MSTTRNNHFVPQWYQERFLADGRRTLSYLDLDPPLYPQRDGSTTRGRALFDAPTSRAFCRKDLYSTFFGVAVNDEIERHLFGDIDRRGADAIRAFASTDQGEWHAHFEPFFEYIDIQKLRTPKGLSWLQKHYPELSQNELMLEMQSIRFLNCTIWTTGVREIVSAERSNVKFIVTDDPVTIYNYAVSPIAPLNKVLNDPSIALKGTQTIFPLGPDHCLILSNLEYAKNPDVEPLEERTFARNYRPTMVSTIEFIRERELNDLQVSEINFILKATAQRHIAAGREEWLYPERTVTRSWRDLRDTLQPPTDELYRFGGEMYARYESGHVHYQDEFGRTEKPRPFLQKRLPASPLKHNEPCGCGSGSPFRLCCSAKPTELRPTWTEKSIRERNMMLFGALINLLELDKKDWKQVRRDLTDEKIAKAYRLYEGLWPLDTDLLKLLPKPDGQLRSVFTGSLHPSHVHEFALSSGLYFGEILMQHPFINSATLNKQYRPTENPRQYRGEFLKAMVLFMDVMPLVEAGLVNLIPDPCDFDFHLREQMMALARARAAGFKFDLRDDPRMEELMREEYTRTLLALPDDSLRRQIARRAPKEDRLDIEELMPAAAQLREGDPLAILQEGSLGSGSGGQLQVIRMVPNFEIAMYLAQATGAQILTDSKHRWLELSAALNRRYLGTSPALRSLSTSISAEPLAFPASWRDVLKLAEMPEFVAFRAIIRSTFSYLQNLEMGDEKPNFEAQLAGRYARSSKATRGAIKKARVAHSLGQPQAVLRFGGLQDNTVNRLLLMSSSSHNLARVPMATFVDRVRRSA